MEFLWNSFGTLPFPHRTLTLPPRNPLLSRATNLPDEPKIVCSLLAAV